MVRAITRSCCSFLHRALLFDSFPGIALLLSAGAIMGCSGHSPNNTGGPGDPPQTTSITIAVSPKRAALSVTQTVSVTPTTNDSAGVTWSAAGPGCSDNACGSFTTPVGLSGAAVTYTAPNTAGTYTITATSVTDKTVSVTASVAVTDLSGVVTYHNNPARTGVNTQEYALTPSNVTASTFGKLFSCAVDGAIYAQPLWVPNLTIASVKHNVVFVATQNDSLYAFDADASGTPCTPLWHANLLDTAHGGLAGEAPVPTSGSGHLVGVGLGDIAPVVGVLGTPVIDPTTKTLYLVSKSVISSSLSFYQRLHAIDLTTGQEKFSGPVTIAATYPGYGDGGTTTTFSARQENQRPGLVLSNGVVYIAWAAHEDQVPFYGWVIGYNAGNLSQVSVFNVAPNTDEGGIWMSGGAPAVDTSGNLYLTTGNSVFDATNAPPLNNDYGDSFLELDSQLKLKQYFTPSDEQSDYLNDNDFGAGGAVVLIDLPPNGSNPTHLILGGGKDGTLYVLNRDKMGGVGDTNAWQKLDLGHGLFATGAFWNSKFYVAALKGNLQAFSLSPSTAQLTPVATATSTTFGFPGATPSISSMPDNSNGIVWALDTSLHCTNPGNKCGPTVLHAYDADDLSNELWNSSQGSGNAAGSAVKFTVPTVANGKVYVGTGPPNDTSMTPSELDVYGLLPN